MGKVTAVIPAAGVGSRMGANVKKQYLLLDGTTILARTISALEKCPGIDHIVLVVGPGEEEFCRNHILQDQGFSKVVAVVPGGDHRQSSVYHGICALPADTEMVVIHDGARPLVQPQEISRVLQAAREIGAAALAVPVKDTIKLVDEQGIVENTPPRQSLWAVQTPQAFRHQLIMEAHRKALATGELATDDCALVEKVGHPVKLVMGSYENIKITTPEDLALAETFLRRRGRQCE